MYEYQGRLLNTEECTLLSGLPCCMSLERASDEDSKKCGCECPFATNVTENVSFFLIYNFMRI